jgi:hypothetical protein
MGARLGVGEARPEGGGGKTVEVGPSAGAVRRTVGDALGLVGADWHAPRTTAVNAQLASADARIEPRPDWGAEDLP